MIICDLKACTGCCCCLNVCPSDAIYMVEDEMGKTVSQIDESRCISCMLCVMKCPVNRSVSFYRPHACYALWTKDHVDRESCASGGVATGFSRWVIQQEGVVFGAIFDAKQRLCHEMVDEENKLEALKRSKYVQSFIGTSYRRVKEQLVMGKYVLFVGTPCQIDGLHGYLGREHETLVTVDLICHGTPPAAYLREYVHYTAAQRNNTADHVTFRGGKDDYFLTLWNRHDVIYRKEANLDSYFTAFLYGLIFRDNCYHCQYAKPDRVSDITIGDFWGLDRTTLSNSYDGKISLALINTKRGQEFFARVNHLFTWETRSVEEAIDGNPQLQKPAVKDRDRERFEKAYKIGGFVKAIHSTTIPRRIKIAKIRRIATSPIRIARKVHRRIKLKMDSKHQ